MGKSRHQRRIELFMKKAGQRVPSFPSIPDEKTLKLRAGLILEEAIETITAMGLSVLISNKDSVNPKEFNVTSDNYNKLVSFLENGQPSLRAIADGCADLSVVTIGSLSSLGIDDNPLLKLVDDNNLDKFGDGHSIRDDGKLIKPLWHLPPNIQKLLSNVPLSTHLPYFFRRIIKSGKSIQFLRGKDIQPLQRNLVLDFDFHEEVGCEKVSWRCPSNELFLVENGIWYFKSGIVWDGTTVVPDGRPDPIRPYYPITWKASLAHDMGYYCLRNYPDFPYSRAEIDHIFYYLLLQCGFKYATLYYIGVRLFGGLFLRLGRG